VTKTGLARTGAREKVAYHLLATINKLPSRKTNVKEKSREWSQSAGLQLPPEEAVNDSLRRELVHDQRATIAQGERNQPNSNDKILFDYNLVKEK